jgi:MoxR-like ATPase
MEERQVTIEGEAHPLPAPFMVVATQNPVEYVGTYPLPEAQLDRFLLKLTVAYPSEEQELKMLSRHDEGMDPHDLAAAGLRAVASGADLAAAGAAVGGVRIEPPVLAYIAAVCRATRDSPSLTLGVSPRGAVMLLRAAKAWTWLSGREFVTPDEVKAMARPALRHRIQLRPEVALDGVTPDGVLEGILTSVPVPR